MLSIEGSATYKGSSIAKRAHYEARGTVVSAGHFYFTKITMINKILRRPE